MPLLVNAVLYTTSASPDITAGVTKWRRLEQELATAKIKKQRRRIQGELGAVPKTAQYRLGASIPVVYGKPRAVDVSAEAKTARKILKRFQVRGHWHWFRHGTGRGLRKHQFVAPYWKGPTDLAELLKRKYQLK